VGLNVSRLVFDVLFCEDGLRASSAAGLIVCNVLPTTIEPIRSGGIGQSSV
jgi:hypothetical protein